MIPFGKDEQKSISVNFECPVCFVNYNEEFDLDYKGPLFDKEKCDYCAEKEKMFPMKLDKRVERILSVMQHTCAHRLPEILRLVHEDAKYGGREDK